MFRNIRDKVLSIFTKEEVSPKEPIEELDDNVVEETKEETQILEYEYVQYHHEKENGEDLCHNPCLRCSSNNLRIFENNDNKPPVGEENHPHCHCYYEGVEQKAIGSISTMGDLAPDVYLKKYGRLPDYYITKEEAKEQYGWIQGKNTIAGKAPGKMIGGDIFDNDKQILPGKEGRIWYECDIDYKSGRRNTKRLYYSNDGLMFYSESHNEREVIQIK